MRYEKFFFCMCHPQKVVRAQGKKNICILSPSPLYFVKWENTLQLKKEQKSNKGQRLKQKWNKKKQKIGIISKIFTK